MAKNLIVEKCELMMMLVKSSSAVGYINYWYMSYQHMPVYNLFSENIPINFVPI